MHFLDVLERHSGPEVLALPRLSDHTVEFIDLFEGETLIYVSNATLHRSFGRHISYLLFRKS